MATLKTKSLQAPRSARRIRNSALPLTPKKSAKPASKRSFEGAPIYCDLQWFNEMRAIREREAATPSNWANRIYLIENAIKSWLRFEPWVHSIGIKFSNDIKTLYIFVRAKAPDDTTLDHALTAKQLGMMVACVFDVASDGSLTSQLDPDCRVITPKNAK